MIILVDLTNKISIFEHWKRKTVHEKIKIVGPRTFERQQNILEMTASATIFPNL